LAEKFLIRLSEWLARQWGWSIESARHRVLLVPGNHDSSWALTTGLKGDEEEDFVMFGSAAYANSVNRFYGGAVFWDMEKPCLTRLFLEYSISFILASTAHRVTMTNRRGQIGEAVRTQIVKALSQQEVQGSLFRIGLIHHNLIPFHDTGECLLDSPILGIELATCRPGFDLIIHGHVHQGEVDFFHPRKGLPPIPYSCVGSFGVQAEHRPGDDKRGRVPNQFSVIELEASKSGRRFSTCFFSHEHTPTGKWDWEMLKKEGPINLE
jgi:calcineurin-like phosphoesterase family protein